MLESLEKGILASPFKKLSDVIEEFSTQEEAVRLIRISLGVGLITGATIRAHMNYNKRFETSSQIAAFAGLVPWIQIPNEQIHQDHITKRVPMITYGSVTDCSWNDSMQASYRKLLDYASLRPFKEDKGIWTEHYRHSTNFE